jgi:quercetin dioxygenase-like cupin family protein/hemerythrin-like domain-containing protein
VKRHSSLVPLSRDHHRTLVHARRLRRAANGDIAGRREGAASFLRFFANEAVRHFRQEEERLFPLLIDTPGRVEDLVVQALLEHQRLHAIVARLGGGLSTGSADAELMRQIADLLESHTRFEERRLFPLAEELAAEALNGLDLGGAHVADRDPIVDLFAPLGRGPLWGSDTDDLNATLLAWAAGAGPPEHVNGERDVLVLVLAGSAVVTIDDTRHEMHAGDVVIVKKGLSRRITAGADGVRYLSVHRRRAPLQITPSNRRQGDHGAS